LHCLLYAFGMTEHSPPARLWSRRTDDGPVPVVPSAMAAALSVHRSREGGVSPGL